MSPVRVSRQGSHSLPVADWPQIDRDAWLRGTQARRGPFRKNGGGKPLSKATYWKREQGYGTWLWFMNSRGLLDVGQRPEARITLEHLDAYLEHLTNSGLSDYTIVGRFEELRGAIQTICPTGDFTYVTRPGDVSIRQLLPMTRKTLFIPDVMTTLKWAEDLFKEALSQSVPDRRRILVRDAAIIGILADRAPRLRALCSLQIGLHIRQVGEEWQLLQDAPIMKMRNTLEMPISSRIGPILERYIRIEREELLGGRSNDQLWVTTNGNTLGYKSVQYILRYRSFLRFGQSVSAHRFRASLATTEALLNTASALDTSTILGHSPEIALKHYNRATAIAASRRHDEYLTELMSDTSDAFDGNDEEEFRLEPPPLSSLKIPRIRNRKRKSAEKEKIPKIHLNYPIYSE